MEPAIRCLKQLAKSADKATRQKLATYLLNITHSMEDPGDTVNRFGYLVCPIHVAFPSGEGLILDYSISRQLL